MTKPKSNTLDEWLSAYDDIGWITIPIRKKSKVPLVYEWQTREDNAEDGVVKLVKNEAGEVIERITKPIEQIWRENKSGNIGIVAGEASGILVLDVDYKSGKDNDGNEVVLVDGEKSLAELEKVHGKLPTTVEQITGGGVGRHLIFKFRPGLRNKGRHRGDDDKGLDVRSARGQIVVEPSLHPVTGRRYRWKEGHTPWDIEPADMPDWLYDFLPKSEEEKYVPAQVSFSEFTGSSSTRIESYIETALDDEIEGVRNQGEGGRNDRLNEAALKVASLYHHGTFSEEYAKNSLYDAAREAGLRKGETNSTIRSGWNAGIAMPRELPLELYEESDYFEETAELNPGIKISLPSLVEMSETPTEEEIERDVEDEHDFYENKYEVPAGTFDVPGVLGDLCSWIDMCAMRPAPLLTLGCAISMLSALFGRKYRSPTNLRTNLYIVGVAPTSSGKDNARQRVDGLLYEAGVNLICGRIRSDAGLEEALSIRPRLLLFIDEMGDVLGSMEGRTAASWESRIKPVLKELFTSAAGNFRGAMVISREEIIIHEPHLVIYGTTTHDQFYDALSNASVKDGFLNRLLVFELPEGRAKKRKINHTLLRPPPMLVDWVKRVESYVPDDPTINGNLSNSGAAAAAGGPVANPIQTVPFTKDAEQLFDDFDEECDSKLEGIASYIWSRAAAHAQKLAVIRAIGCNFEDPCVVDPDAEWAVALTRWSIDRLCRSVIERVAENKVEGDAKRMLMLIREAGPDGIQKNLFTRKTQWLKPRDREDTLKNLTEAGLVLALKVGGTKGRPKVVLQAKSSLL